MSEIIKSTGEIFMKMEEGIDYYLSGGRLVMTEAYHLKRGYCCGNGCRHCPYEHEAVGVKNHKSFNCEIKNTKPVEKEGN